MNDFESRRAARVERLRERAGKARDARAAAHQRVDQLCEVMNGQPVLIGHHSEKRHRRDLERMGDNMRKACALDRAAKDLERRADAAEHNTAVFSDDPEAVRKIKEQIAAKELFRDRCKEVNATIRKAVNAAKRTGADWKEDVRPLLEDLGLSRMAIDNALNPPWGKPGVEAYVLSNVGAEIRRLRKRLVDLEQTATRDGREKTIGEVRIVEEENRVRLFFPDKPSESIRTELKRCGFKWARSIAAWQRHASTGAWYHAERIAALMETPCES